MMNRKPETSLEEDLKTLGILAGDAKKSLSEEDACAMGADKKDDEKAEKPADDGDADDKAEKAEKKPVPSFIDAMKKKEEEKSYTEQLEMAWDVVRNYYGLDEAKDKELTDEDLRTVIDAFAFIVEAQYNSDKMDENPSDIPGGNEVSEFPAGQDPTKQNAAFEGPLGLDKKNKVVGKGGNNMGTRVDKQAAGKPAGGKPAADRQQQSFMGSPAEGANDISNLVSELKSIQSAVVESGPTAEQLAVSTKLIEGFESVRDTAGEIAARIKSELAEAKNVSAEDDRVKAREFFESIFNDANDILSAIAEGNVEIEDATADLKVISTDLKNGLDGLKSVG